MYRLAWFIAGCVFTYFASGYVEGFMDDRQEPGKTGDSEQTTGGAS